MTALLNNVTLTAHVLMALQILPANVGPSGVDDYVTSFLVHLVKLIHVKMVEFAKKLLIRITIPVHVLLHGQAGIVQRYRTLVDHPLVRIMLHVTG